MPNSSIFVKILETPKIHTLLATHDTALIKRRHIGHLLQPDGSLRHDKIGRAHV